MIEPFGAGDFQQLDNGQSITASVPADGMAGFYVSNVTPYFFKVADDLGRLVVTVPPWATVTGAISQATQNLYMTARLDRPTVVVGGTNYSNYGFEVELSPTQQPSQVVQLSVASAANSDVLSARLKMDTGSGALPASPNVARFVQFTNVLAYMELWNLDTQNRDIYINFNQPATGGTSDIRIPVDPNGAGQGAYYSVAAHYSGFWYIGGQGQVAGWYQPNATGSGA